jgi:hypothetical protein
MKLISPVQCVGDSRLKLISVPRGPTFDCQPDIFFIVTAARFSDTDNEGSYKGPFHLLKSSNIVNKASTVVVDTGLTVQYFSLAKVAVKTGSQSVWPRYMY